MVTTWTHPRSRRLLLPRRCGWPQLRHDQAWDGSRHRTGTVTHGGKVMLAILVIDWDGGSQARHLSFLASMGTGMLHTCTEWGVASLFALADPALRRVGYLDLRLHRPRCLLWTELCDAHGGERIVRLTCWLVQLRIALFAHDPSTLLLPAIVSTMVLAIFRRILLESVAPDSLERSIMKF
jgi:hypothetical protein